MFGGKGRGKGKEGEPLKEGKDWTEDATHSERRGRRNGREERGKKGKGRGKGGKGKGSYMEREKKREERRGERKRGNVKARKRTWMAF